MNAERKRLLGDLVRLTDAGHSVREAARVLGISVGKATGILRDASEAKRHANRRPHKREAPGSHIPGAAAR